MQNFELLRVYFNQNYAFKIKFLMFQNNLE